MFSVRHWSKDSKTSKISKDGGKNPAELETWEKVLNTSLILTGIDDSQGISAKMMSY